MTAFYRCEILEWYELHIGTNYSQNVIIWYRSSQAAVIKSNDCVFYKNENLNMIKHLYSKLISYRQGRI